jgi:Dit-like tail protein
VINTAGNPIALPDSVVHLSWTDASGTYVTFTFDLVEDEQWNLGSDVTKHPVEVGAAVSDNVRPRQRKVNLKIHATNEPLAASYWSPASMQPAGPLAATNQEAINIATGLGAGPATITAGDGVVIVPDWDSMLELRVIAGAASGVIGSSLGGSVGGALGSIAGSALAGALFPGHVVPRVLQTDASVIEPTWAVQQTINPTVLTFDAPADFVGATIALLATLNDTGQTIDVFGSKDSCVGPPGIGGMAIADFTYDRNYDGGTGAAIALALEQIRVVSTVTVPAPKPTAKDATASVSKGNQNPTELEAAASKIAAAAAAGYTQGLADAGPDDPGSGTPGL